MLTSLKDFLQRRRETPDGVEDGQRTLRLAAATLLAEVARADFEDAPEERAAMERLLSEQFGLDPEEAAQLRMLAQQEAEQATSLYEHTHLVNQGFSRAEKRRMLELLWQVVFADGRLDKHEEALMRRLTDLLYLSHSDYIRTKLKVHPEG